MCEAAWKEVNRELMHLLSRSLEKRRSHFTGSAGVAVLVVAV